MSQHTNRARLLTTTMICGVVMASATSAWAQQQAPAQPPAQEEDQGTAGLGVPQSASPTDEADLNEPGEVSEVVVTGSRIRRPGLVSTSPIQSVGEQEIRLQQTPEVEQVLRQLPAIQPADNATVNNGTAGAATISLRGLGAQRNLILIDGKRVTPYDVSGIVDTSVIPTALLERVDVITGGASAVYGSDAIAGAINFILKRDFEGVELETNYRVTEEGDGKTLQQAATIGGNFMDGRGNAVVHVNYSKRDGVLLGDRFLGTLGIVTATGGNFTQFQQGQGPVPAPANCGGTGSVAAGGSTTTIPTRVAIAGGPGLGQFREDGTLGANCSVFNFNPFNFYQTPQERYGGTALGSFEVTDKIEAYSRFTFSNTSVRQQIAPSGFFGTPVFVPLANPFLTAQARQFIIDRANAGLAAGTVTTTGALPNFRDVNNDRRVDAGDELLLSIRRRTTELGPRSANFDQNYFQFVLGARGDITENLSYDVSVQHGQSDRTNVQAGYTNVANLVHSVNTVNGTTCRTGGSACVPANLFGAEGAISAAAAAYLEAIGILKSDYEQTIITGSVSGSLPFIVSPLANEPLAFSVGAEYREESGETTPDLCLQLAPSSCLGGAGGNTLPIVGRFDTHELFGELIVPFVQDRPFFNALDLELGYRFSDYNPTGIANAYKAGVNYEPFDGLRFRVQQQRAVRAPNVGELAAPQTASLQNAGLDPCSVANARNITAAIRARCIATGQTPAQVGTVEDIVSGQINTFSGTDLQNLPDFETADTFTAGVVFQPRFFSFLRNTSVSLDYYKIEIDDVIGTFDPQEILDACYTGGQLDQCAKIVRIGGTLTLPGSGVQTFTTNLLRQEAEGVELAANAELDMERLGLGRFGRLQMQYVGNQYLTQESQSNVTQPTVDCLGVFTTFTTCGQPLPEYRHAQRTVLDLGRVSLSYLWRHLGELQVDEARRDGVGDDDIFAAFQQIEAYDYIDLAATFDLNDAIRLTAGVTNVFEEDPPVVGNEAGTTAANSGNTFPALYDVLGRVFSVGVNLRF
ncbi:MAG: TonB-dependent receptor [Proteobacteria bacterium]|nr:TonB-dependent receptor [Pseudomonadota bacterium]